VAAVFQLGEREAQAWAQEEPWRAGTTPVGRGGVRWYEDEHGVFHPSG
jgi:hypothetical protein